MYSKVKDLPESLQSALKSIDYTRADIELEVKESVSPIVGGGDGKRGFCCIVNIETGEEKTTIGSWGGSNMFSASQVNPVDSDHNSYPIPPNMAVIKGTMGGNHPTYATITLSPDNIIKALSPKPELDPRDKWVLYCFKALTSAGRKNEFERCNDKPSEADLQRFVANGWIKRRSDGACQITTEGKNALGSTGSVYHPKNKF